MDKGKTCYLTDSFEIDGRWFLPGQDIEINGIFGTLKYSPDSITLQLQGMFVDFDPIEDEDLSKRITIYGFSNKGERLSLFNCALSHASRSFPGYSTCSYYVGRFYAGDFVIENENELEGGEANFSFLNIDAWLRYHVLTMISSEDRKKIDLSIDFEPKNIDKKTFSLSGLGIKLSEEIGYNIQYPKDYFQDETLRVSFQRHYHIEPENNTCVSPKVLFEIMQEYRRLLVLLVGSPMYFSYIEFRIPAGVINDNGEERPISKKTRLFFTQVGDILNAKKLSPYKPRSILIRREDIEDQLEPIINTWFEKNEKFTTAIAAFISDLYLPGYIETKFLNCAKGLEAYHRFFISSNCKSKSDMNVVLDADRDKIVDFIIQNTAPENHDYFLSRVNYEEEDSYRTRLKMLLNGLPDGLRKKLFGVISKKGLNSFISQVVETRNYYTHRDSIDNYKNAVVDIGPLSDIVHQLSAVLRYYCLIEIGIESTQAEKSLVDWLAS